MLGTRRMRVVGISTTRRENMCGSLYQAWALKLLYILRLSAVWRGVFKGCAGMLLVLKKSFVPPSVTRGEHGVYIDVNNPKGLWLNDC